MYMLYIDKCRYEMQEQKVPVWYTGIYRLISSTGDTHEMNAYNASVRQPVSLSELLHSRSGGSILMKFGMGLCHWRLP
jgi:hypothetical protein